MGDPANHSTIGDDGAMDSRAPITIASPHHHMPVIDGIPTDSLRFNTSTGQVIASGTNGRGENAGSAVDIDSGRTDLLMITAAWAAIEQSDYSPDRRAIVLSSDATVAIGRTPQGTGYLNINSVRISAPALDRA